MINAIKYLSLGLLLALFLCSFIVQDKTLYLLYSQNDDRIGIIHLGRNAPATFLYKIKYKNKEYANLPLAELYPDQRDTVEIDKISVLHPKHIDWLTREYLEYYNYFRGEHPRIDKDGTLKAFNLNKIYGTIYIIMPDSCSGKAVITQVVYNPAFSID